MMVAPGDEMVHADYGVARRTYELMPQPKEWDDVDGGHFGLLYHPGRLFDAAARVQSELLQRWLPREVHG